MPKIKNHRDKHSFFISGELFFLILIFFKNFEQKKCPLSPKLFPIIKAIGLNIGIFPTLFGNNTD